MDKWKKFVKFQKNNISIKFGKFDKIDKFENFKKLTIF